MSDANGADGKQGRLDTPRFGRTALVLALVEILLSGLILYWAFAHGMHDDSSMGTVVFLWGAIAAFLGLLVPGIVLLIPSRFRWVLQPFAALVAVLFAFLVLSGVLMAVIFST